MKKRYTAPSLTMFHLHCNDIITASIQDDEKGFSLDWIGLE